jgi:hypothetical protein
MFHALFEVALDVLKRTKAVTEPKATQQAITATNYASTRAGRLETRTGPKRLQDPPSSPVSGNVPRRVSRFRCDQGQCGLEQHSEVRHLEAAELKTA